MANGGSDSHVRVVSRRFVKASDPSLKPHVLAVSNLDLLPLTMPVSLVCIYPKPSTGNFDAVVAAFAAVLPSFLNHFFPFAGRIAANRYTDLPDVVCNNEGAEFVVGESNVPLASLNFGAMAASLQKILIRYDNDMALSVQLVSFPCGGFSVAWGSNHVVTDGHALCMLASMWSELVRSGVLVSVPNHDRSVFRPRATPVYSSSLDEAFTPLTHENLVNVLTSESLVERLYYLEAHDIARLRALASTGAARATRVEAVSAYLWKVLARVVGTSDTRCRMGWWVDGRRRLKVPKYRAAMRHYIGNVTTYAVREVGVEEIQHRPLSDVASMVREAFSAKSYDAHFQELVDWVEEHKVGRYVETATVGQGSPTVSVTSFVSFPLDTDFGFGHAAFAMPAWPSEGDVSRLCSGFLQLIPRPGDDGSWFVSALVWPRLAAALESDGELVFKPVTAECLGLTAAEIPGTRLSRL